MSNDPKLVASRRENVGTSATKKLRRDGQIPGNVYGHKLESIPFSVSGDALTPIVTSGHKVVDLEIDGKVEKTMIQDVQWDTFQSFVQHVDLLRVDENERVSTTVELVVRGISPGVLAGGILEQPHHTLPIECPVIRLPDNIVVRIGSLKLGESIHVSDLVLPPDVTTTLPPEEVILHVVVPRKAEEPATEEATEATA